MLKSIWSVYSRTLIQCVCVQSFGGGRSVSPRSWARAEEVLTDFPLRPLQGPTLKMWFSFISSVWHDHHHRPVYCLCHDWNVWGPFRNGSWNLPADHHPGNFGEHQHYSLPDEHTHYPARIKHLNQALEAHMRGQSPHVCPSETLRVRNLLSLSVEPCAWLSK